MGEFPLIRLVNVVKKYHLESGDVVALAGISLDIGEGEFVAIMGPSGSGKSTLMNQIGILDIPSSGELLIEGVNTADMTDLERTHLRRDAIGYVFQKFFLIPLLSAYENVEYPLILKYKERDSKGVVVKTLLEVGIDEELAAHRPSQLSGGQQQRVAIARALINDPKILLCDEPTGNLDRKTGDQIMGILTGLNRMGRTLIVVTHDTYIAEQAGRIVRIEDGALV